MSVRRARADARTVLAGEAARIKAAGAELAAQGAAIELAIDALKAEPRELVEAELQLECVPRNLALLEVARCSECSGRSDGFTPDWKWCPLCGASIAKVTRESSPVERYQREAIASAIQKVSEKSNGR